MILQSTSEATQLAENDSLYASMSNLENVTGTVFSMYGVLIIVLIASVIISGRPSGRWRLKACCYNLSLVEEWKSEIFKQLRASTLW